MSKILLENKLDYKRNKLQFICVRIQDYHNFMAQVQYFFDTNEIQYKSDSITPATISQHLRVIHDIAMKESKKLDTVNRRTKNNYE